MLKLWKQAWKRADATPSPSGQGSDQRDQLSGTSNGRTSSVSTAAVVPLNVSDHSDSAMFSAEQLLRTKRDQSTRPIVDEELHPTKRFKMELKSMDPLNDSIVSRLPEMAEADLSFVPDIGPFTIESQRDALIQAQSGNVIAVLNNFHDTFSLADAFLRQAINADYMDIGLTSDHCTTLFLVEDGPTPSSADNYAQSLSKMSGLTSAYISSSEDTRLSDQWKAVLHSDVVVISPTSLIAACISLSQIYAIFILDARPVKDKDFHPMVRVMTEFYSTANERSRPRILACLSSQLFFDVTMLKLEDTLKAIVFGVSDDTRANLLSIPDCPNEIVMFYEQPSKHTFTLLYKQLRQIDKEESIERYHFSEARHALTEVGSCASDLVWRRALNDIEASIRSIHDDEEEDDDDEPDSVVMQTRARVQMRNIIRNWIFTMPNLDPSSRGFNVTPKFLKLVNILRTCQPYRDTFRGIIFVQKRAVALVIVDLLRTLDMAYLRPHAFVGHGPLSTPQTQSEIIHAFGMGTYNLLIATKCAEDLEIPKASIVIRYDIFEVRYHTRTAVLEQGDARLDVPLQLWAEKVASSPRGAVPPRELHETHDPYLSESEDEDEPDSYIKDPTTSGRIRLQDATGIIYRFASAVKDTDDDFADIPLFEFQDITCEGNAQRQFVCTVNLPAAVPITHIRGRPCASISLARRVACFETCSALFDQGLLDYHFFPQPLNSSAFRNGAPDISEVLEDDIATLPPKGSSQNKLNGTRCYPRKQPDFWSNTLAAKPNPDCLYPVIVVADRYLNSNEPYGPMMVLTRLPLPSISNFKLFDSGVATDVHLRKGAAFDIDQQRLHDLYRYTIRVCRTLLNKPFVCPLDRMPYFFAPVKLSWEGVSDQTDYRWRLPKVVDAIPWDLVSLAAKHWVVPLQSGSVEAIATDVTDAIIQDRWVEFTRRHYVICVRPDLTPLSKPPDSQREAAYENMVEYCKEHRKGFEGLNDYGQPLIQVDRVYPVLNRLNPTIKPANSPAKPPAKYLIPELCAKFTIPARFIHFSTFRTALLLPSIMRRIDDLLLVKELNALFFDHAISDHLLHAAISAPSAGIQFDYERLELLGDAYLKYLSSIYLFVTNPSQHEGALHSARLRIISNKALLLNADRAGLPPFIQAKPFVSKLWQPPFFHVVPPPQPHAATSKGDGEDADAHHEVHTSNDSPSATAGNSDVVEAPSGQTGLPEATTVPSGTQRMPETSFRPDSDGKNVSTSLPTEDSGHDEGQMDDSQSNAELQRSKRKRQQDEKNVHWLGDKAVADVAEAIVGAAYVTGGREAALKASKALCIAVPRIDRWSDFGRKALAPPPDVTAKLRPGSIRAVEKIIGHKFTRPHLLAQALGAMVSNAALAAVCIQAGLHEHLIFESFTLASNIQTYAENIKAKQAEEHDLAAKEGRSPGQYWVDVEPPKALSDVVESIIGAIYISDNFSPVGVEIFFDNVLKPFYDTHITLKTLSHHPTKILFELFQAQGCQMFEMIKGQERTDDKQQTTRCDVLVHDVVLASAEDITSALATKQASLRALDALEGDPDFMTRTCDCRALMQAKKAKKKTLKQVMAGFSDEEDEDLKAVEGALNVKDATESGDEDA
ncbi:hypothetical protein EW146_g2946 [Bondarzewia mesenterica]|uniref:RNase III domain-containing protein n=1 Tax=Bondarzewia mesenterica TaxID=1095465 RepID=A0A4S4LZ60_9AGAM|nr:hypothetical protein EW146_g2946 [Bondarzewia mesenterica]